jgi:RNA recognition motif-containing protein
MSSDILTFGDWDVTFTEGAAVSHVQLRRVHTDILLKNLSSSFSNEQLQAEIARFGSASVSRESRRKRARLRFVDSAAAETALVELDNKRLGMSRVETILDRSKDIQWIENGILLVYDTCQTSAEIAFTHEADATEALKLHRSTFHGRRIRVLQDDPTHLTVEELPAIFEEDDLLTFFSADTVSVTRDYGEDMDTSALLQSLIREQPGCASLHLKKLITDLGQGAGWIKMYNDDRAAEVSTEVRGMYGIFSDECLLILAKGFDQSSSQETLSKLTEHRLWFGN